MPDTTEALSAQRTSDAAANCASEPIHILGRVQSHGVLLCLDAAGRVTQASANVEAILGWPQADVAGCDPSELIQGVASESLAAVVAVARTGRETCERVQVSPKSTPDIPGDFDLRAHCHDGNIILELETADPAQRACGTLLGEPETTLDRLSAHVDTQALLDDLAREVRRLSGFDLVMVYRFDEHWNGEVVAEDKSDSAHSYLGQKFPSSDIPAQAREVFRHNHSRMIADVNAPPAMLVPIHNPATGRPLDMGRAHLRSPSPVHLHYLRNMGTAATFTISLVAFDRLWGLVACHHAAPRRPDLSHRRLCEWVGRHASQRIECLERAREKSRVDALEKVTDALHLAMRKSSRLTDGLFKSNVSMLHLLPNHHGTGVALLYDGKWHLSGRTPPMAALRDLYAGLSDRLVGSQVMVLERLSQVYPSMSMPALGFAGLVAFRIEKREPTVAMWFLPEVIQTIDWAGEPEKQVTMEGGRATLHPRHSFRVWRETVGGQAAPVLPAEIKAIADLRQAIVECDLQQQVAFERAARLELQAQRRRLGVLAAASMNLAVKGDLETVMDGFAAALADTFCDWCAIHVKRHGQVVRVAIRHGTEEGQRVISEMWDMPYTEVSAESMDVYKPMVAPADLAHFTSDPHLLALLLGKLGCQSLITKPLSIGGENLGWIAFVRGGPRTPFLPEDVEIAAELAARAASRAESALHLERLAEALAFRDQILNVVSHDLRNPLGVVSLCADGLRRHIDKERPDVPEAALRAVGKISIACRRMNALIQDLLNLGKLEANRLSIAPKPCECSTLAQQTFDELDLLARTSRVELKLEPPSGADLTVHCDRDRFLQVMSNLVGNALKFSQPGTAITLGWKPRQDGYVEFFVRDQGAGIAPEHLSRIFEPFWQGGTNQSRVKGAGLGLAIVKGLVEAHRGTVSVSSTQGKGTEFAFTLPSVQISSPSASPGD